MVEEDVSIQNSIIIDKEVFAQCLKESNKNGNIFLMKGCRILFLTILSTL